MKAIAWITALVLWGSFVACSWCEGQAFAKKSVPGKMADGSYQDEHMAPPKVVDINGRPINMDFKWDKARDPFRRVK